MWGYFFAFLSPLVWASVNVLDKYIISRRVKYPLGFAVLAGQFHILLGVLIALLTSWDNVGLFEIFLAGIPGLFIGLQLYVYYFVIRDHDVSLSSGLMFLYPLLVAIFGKLFLQESLRTMGYLGMFLVVLGVVWLSWRQNINGWPILIMGLSLTAVDLFAKVATNNLALLQAVAIAAFVTGITIQPLLLSTKFRKQYRQEWGVRKLALITELFGITSFFVFYAALEYLPVTIVSTIGVTQVFWVLVLERLVHKKIGGIHSEYLLIRRLFSLVLVGLGIAFLFLT